MELTRSTQRYEVWRGIRDEEYTVERKRQDGKWIKVGERKTVAGVQSMISKDIERTQDSDMMISVIEWFVPEGDGPQE